VLEIRRNKIEYADNTPHAAAAVSIISGCTRVKLVHKQREHVKNKQHDHNKTKRHQPAARAHSVNKASMSATMRGSRSLLGVSGRGLSGKYCKLIFSRRAVGVWGCMYSELNDAIR
jgi:hypothetical protein